MIRKIIVALLSPVVLAGPHARRLSPRSAATPADDHQLVLQLLQRVNELESEIRQLKAGEASKTGQAQANPAPAETAQALAPPLSPPPVTVSTPTATTAAGGMSNMGLPDVAGLQFRGFADALFTDNTQKGTHSTFSEDAGFDFFMTSRMSDQFSALAEMLIEYAPTNATELDLERLELHYTPSDYFNLTAGRFHTAIGYYNTAYHHASWLLPTVTRPVLFEFEDQGGILPTHTEGLSATGSIPSGPLGLHYIAEIGNGRSASALTSVPVVQDDNNRKSYNFAGFSRPAAIPGLQAGFSFYGDRLYPVGMKIAETISDAYVTYHPSGFEFTTEGLVIRHALEGTNIVFHTPGFYSILAKSVGHGVTPYFSYQYVNDARREPLFGASTGLNHGPATGIRYDFTDFLAWKLEYYRVMRRADTGRQRNQSGCRVHLLMNIRRRLTLSSIAILGLLAINLVVYFWGDRRRQATVEELRRAISRQILISDIRQELSDYEKQVTLLSQINADANAGGANPGEVAAFNKGLDGIGDQLRTMSALDDTDGRRMIETFTASFRELSASWRIFYKNFGRNQSLAITEEVMHSEPLGQKVLKELLPDLQHHQTASVEDASTRFYDAARTTDRITVVIFFLTVGLAGTLALMVSRPLTGGLALLKTGADALGGGDLAYRIPSVSKDELGDLARTFNDMAGRLQSARDELQVLMDRERLKSEELERTLVQLKATQDQLLVQEKMASLGALTAGIAHEIKNPLNFVTNFAALSVELIDEANELFAQFRQKPDNADAEYLGQLFSDLHTNLHKIEEHGKRADSIVKGMLAHSRGGAGQFQPTDVNALIAEAASLAYHGLRAQDVDFNIALENVFDPALPTISVVPQDLSRAILNIVNNGCYAAHQRAVRQPGFQPVLRCTTVRTPAGVEIRIRDNGTGIPKEVLPRIFNPFFTTKPTGSGTGLGLSLSYQIVVDQHKGAMRVETEEGEFTEFILTLPERAA